jgi:DNA-binding phage protein
MKVETILPIIEAIKKKVENSEVSIYLLAKQTGMSENQLYKILRHGHIPTVNSLEKLLDAVYGVDVDNLTK